ncbi:MAG: AEC family transporter [Coprobacillus sp.]
MELSLLLMQQICQLFIMIFFGFLLVKSKTLKSEDSKVLSRVALFVVSPCAILTSFMIDFTPDKLFGLGLAVLGALIVHIVWIPLTSLLSKVFGFAPIEKATIIYSNSGNLIIPLVGALLGKEWVLYTSGYMMVQTVLMWTHAKSLVCNERNYDLKKIFLNVNVIAVSVGIVFFLLQIQLPGLVVTTIDRVGSMIGPLAMLVIGMLIGQMNLKDIFMEKRTYLIAFMRLIVYPLIIILIFKLTGLTAISSDANQIFLITILAASAPAAATITQFAQLYNKHPGYASIMNVMSVIFSIITMPLLVMLYQLL